MEGLFKMLKLYSISVGVCRSCGATTNHKIVISYSDDCWASFPLRNCSKIDKMVLTVGEEDEQRASAARGAQTLVPVTQAEKAAEFAYSQASWKLRSARCKPLVF